MIKLWSGRGTCKHKASNFSCYNRWSCYTERLVDGSVSVGLNSITTRLA